MYWNKEDLVIDGINTLNPCSTVPLSRKIHKTILTVLTKKTANKMYNNRIYNFTDTILKHL